MSLSHQPTFTGKVQGLLRTKMEGGRIFAELVLHFIIRKVFLHNLMQVQYSGSKFCPSVTCVVCDEMKEPTADIPVLCANTLVFSYINNCCWWKSDVKFWHDAP